MIIFQELEQVSGDTIKRRTGISSDKAFESFKNYLIERNILSVTKNDLYSFAYVGLIIYENQVIFCLPKYIKQSNPASTIKQLFSLLNQYSRRETLEEDELFLLGAYDFLKHFNLLSVITFLLQDYSENGLYSNEKRIFETNGRNEINWVKTIDEIQPIITKNIPIYLNFLTYAQAIDEENYFRKLHKLVLNQCSQILEDFGLLDILGFQSIYFEVSSDYFGSNEFILSKLINELSIQYINRKQLVLRAMYAFFSNEDISYGDMRISLFGTRNFNLVWEKVCASVFNDQSDFYKQFIDKPRWQSSSGLNHTKPTLIPDILTLEKHEEVRIFIIADAKYYDIELSDEILEKNPGINDVVKQYAYQMAFSSYLNRENINVVRNTFLFPVDGTEIEDIGIVYLPFFNDLELEDIVLLKLPANIIFETYINYETIKFKDILSVQIEPT